MNDLEAFSHSLIIPGEAGKESLESIAFQYVSRLSQMLRRLLPGSDKGAKTWYLG